MDILLPLRDFFPIPLIGKAWAISRHSQFRTSKSHQVLSHFECHIPYVNPLDAGGFFGSTLGGPYFRVGTFVNPCLLKKSETRTGRNAMNIHGCYCRPTWRGAMVQTNLTQTQDAASKKGTRAFVALRRSGELARIGRSIIRVYVENKFSTWET